MEDVIRKIIRIEETAQNIMAETLKENEQKRREADEEISTLQEKIVGDAHRKAKEIRKRELGENAVVAKRIRKECGVKIEAMEAIAAENEEKWVDYLVSQVLGD